MKERKIVGYSTEPRHRGETGVIGADGSTEGDRRNFPVPYVARHRVPLRPIDVLSVGRMAQRLGMAH